MAELVWAKKIFCLTVVIVKDNKVFKLNWTCSWNNVCRKVWQTPAWETCKWISKDGTLKPWIKIRKRSYPQISSPSPIIFSYHIYFRSAFMTSPELSPTHPPPPPPPLPTPPHVQFLPLVTWTVYHISWSGSYPCVPSYYCHLQIRCFTWILPVYNICTPGLSSLSLHLGLIPEYHLYF